MNPGISAEADAATTLRARFVITLFKTPAYRGALKESRREEPVTGDSEFARDRIDQDRGADKEDRILAA
jgi:hypothetical protein